MDFRDYDDCLYLIVYPFDVEQGGRLTMVFTGYCKKELQSTVLIPLSTRSSGNIEELNIDAFDIQVVNNPNSDIDEVFSHGEEIKFEEYSVLSESSSDVDDELTSDRVSDHCLTNNYKYFPVRSRYMLGFFRLWSGNALPMTNKDVPELDISTCESMVLLDLDERQLSRLRHFVVDEMFPLLRNNSSMVTRFKFKPIPSVFSNGMLLGSPLEAEDCYRVCT